MKNVFLIFRCNVFVFLSIFLSRTCGQESTNIVERRPATTGEFPWFAAVYEKTNTDGRTLNKPICGATIISSYSLLSATHCFYDRANNRLKNVSNYEIAVGKITTDRNSVDSEATKFYNLQKIILNDLNGDLENQQRNIVILITENKISFNSQVSAACLRKDSDPVISDYTLLNFAGFKRPANDDPYTLTAIQVPFLSRKECDKHVSQDLSRQITADKFCAGDENVPYFGPGDSGGGMILKDTEGLCPNIIGIVNFGSPANFGITVNTYVPTYYSWIIENIHAAHKNYDKLIFQG